MRTHTTPKRGIFLLLAFATAIGAFSAIASPSIEQGRMAQALNDARQVSIAMETYALDKISAQGSKEYPATLEDLATNNYLTRSDLNRLKRLNRYILPLSNLPVNEDIKVAFLLAIYESTILIYYSDSSVETIQAKD